MKIAIHVTDAAALIAGLESTPTIAEVSATSIPENLREQIAEYFHRATESEVRSGAPHGAWIPNSIRVPKPSPTLPLTDDSVLEAIRVAIAKKVAEDAEAAAREARGRAEKREETAAVLRERKTTTEQWNDLQLGYLSALKPAWPYAPDSDVIGSEEAKAWLAELKQQNDAAYEAAVAAKQAEKAAAAAKEQAKQHYLDHWVATHGDDDLRDQHADGLLPRKQLLELIADSELAKLGIPEEYVFPEPCADRNHDCAVGETTTLPREYFPAWRELKAKLPQGTTWTFKYGNPCLRDEEYGDDGSDDLGSEVYFVDLSIPVGPFRFDRSVGLAARR